MSFLAKILLLLAIVVAAGLVIGYVSTQTTPAGPPAIPPAPLAVSNAPAPPVTAPVKEPFLANNYRSLTGSTAEPNVPISPNLITNWEERLDKILEADVTDQVKGQKMLEIFPDLTAEGQEEYAQHLSNLVSDEDYAGLAHFLTNSALPEAVLDVLVSDALNRPNSLKLPALLNVARDPRHPKAGEAKDLLELYLEEDYGADWPTWESKLNKWLKDNPD